jgi:hypothetical protein
VSLLIHIIWKNQHEFLHVTPMKVKLGCLLLTCTLIAVITVVICRKSMSGANMNIWSLRVDALYYITWLLWLLWLSAGIARPYYKCEHEYLKLVSGCSWLYKPMYFIFVAKNVLYWLGLLVIQEMMSLLLSADNHIENHTYAPLFANILLDRLNALVIVIL